MLWVYTSVRKHDSTKLRGETVYKRDRLTAGCYSKPFSEKENAPLTRVFSPFPPPYDVYQISETSIRFSRTFVSSTIKFQLFSCCSHRNSSTRWMKADRYMSELSFIPFAIFSECDERMIVWIRCLTKVSKHGA